MDAKDGGMAINTDQIQFAVNTPTFKVNTVNQLDKEQNAARVDTQSWKIFDDINSDGSL